MIISIQGFAGIAPMLAPFALKPNQAQVAQNCRLWTGALEPLRDASLTYTTAHAPGTELKSIYRMVNTDPDDTKYWLTFTDAANVVKGAIAGDTEERTYFTGTGKPRKTNAALALTSTPYPGAYLEIGVPAPTTAPTVGVTTAATPDPSEVTETRAYVYTYVTTWDEESAPSPATTADGMPSDNWTISGFVAMPTGEFSFKSIRLYRTSTGNSGTNFLFVGEYTTLAGLQDTVAAVDLGEPLPSMDWLTPPGTSGNTVETRELQGLIALSNGCQAGFVGNDVYIPEPFRPYAYPVRYRQTMKYPVVALSALQSSIVVLTTGTPAIINAADPANSSVQDLDFHQACVSARSVAPFGNGVLYASPDGLVYVGIDGSRNVTQEWFTRETWQQMNPTSMHGCQHDGRYYGFYKGATLPNISTDGGFIFDPTTQLGTFTTTDVYADASFSDMVQDALFISVGNKIYKWGNAGTVRPYSWRSKVFQMPKPTNFSAAQIIAADYSGLTAYFYVDGVLKHTQIVTDQEPFRLPSGFLGLKFEIALAGTSTVLGVHMAETLTELAGV